MFYSSVLADGPCLVLILETMRATEWGARQDTSGYFDAETKQLVREIGDLLTILAVEALNLEAAIETEYPIPSPAEPALDRLSLHDPTQLTQINEAVEALVQADTARASPVLLGWAFVLSRVTRSLVDRGVPESYHAFASQSLRVDLSQSGSAVARPSQPLFQLYASHALAPASSLFPTLLSVLQSPLFGSPTRAGSVGLQDPNAVGYLSVLRGALTCLPLLIRLPFLTAEQYAGLVDAFAALYSHPAAAVLCSQFWQEQGPAAAADEDEMEAASLQAAGEAALVDLARSRFPVQFGPFVAMVRALLAGASQGAGAGPEDEALARQCAVAAYNFLGQLTTMTVVMPPPSPLTPLPYEVVEYPEYAFRLTRQIPASPSVIIPAGTIGQLVSPQGAKPVVVAWECEWSAWRVFADVLENYARAGKPAPTSQTVDVFGADARPAELPIEWDSPHEQECDVTSVLDILRRCVMSEVSLGPQLVQHMAPTSKVENAHLVQVLFRILERAMAGQQAIPTGLVSSLLGLIGALLPSFPNEVWSFLRGSSLLFPSTSATSRWKQDPAKSAVLEGEKQAGSYPVTLALLSLVQALVSEHQISSDAIAAEFVQLKEDVLERALRWVRDEVWPVHQAWRYAHAADKPELTKRVIELYQVVLDEAELSPLASEGKFGAVGGVVVTALLGRPTLAQLAPLLTAVAVGPEPIALLRKALRYADAQAAEDLVQVSLALIRTLLRLRRRVAGTTSSLLEKLILTHAAGPEGFSLGVSTVSAFGSTGRRPELLESISKFVVAQLDPRLAVSAAEVLTLLCISSSEWQPRPPSLIGLLGGPAKAEAFVVATLAIAADPGALEVLQVAVWDLNAAIVETQPSLGLLLVTGKHHPFGVDDPDDKGKGKANQNESAAEIAAQALAKSLAPAPVKPLAHTAIGVALELVAGWTPAWKSPAVLHAVLSFFDFTWQHLVDFGTTLDDTRQRAATWGVLVKIAFEEPGKEPQGGDAVEMQCHKLMAKAHAVRILALDVQAAAARGQAALEACASSKALLAVLKDKAKLSQAVATATSTSCAPELHQGLTQLLGEVFPTVALDKFRNPSSSHPLVDGRKFGAGYVYSVAFLARKLEGFLLDSASMVDPDALDQAVQEAARLNANLSLVEAQVSHTRAWRQLLEIVLPVAKRDGAAAAAVASAATGVANTIAVEAREGQVVATIQAERLLILLSMVHVLPALATAEAKKDLVLLVQDVCRIFSSESLEPLESLARRTAPQFHRTLFQITYLAYRTLNHDSNGRDKVTPDEHAQLLHSTEVILKVMILATRDLLTFARANEDPELAVDLELAMAVVGQLVKSAYVPPATIWITHCQSVDLFRTTFECFVHMPPLEPGQAGPLYAQHVLDFCLALASASARAAEAMALDGLMNALTNNALTAAAEVGAISVIGPDGAQAPAHGLWSSMLELVVCLVLALGEGTQFVEFEVAGFVRLYSPQLVKAVRWHADDALSLPRLAEMQTVTALMHGLVRRTPGPTTACVAAVLYEHTLHLLQHVVYALLHPNHLATRLEPTSIAERCWIEKGEPGVRLDERPAVGAVTVGLVRLARTVVEGLVGFTGAFETLVRDPEDWRTDKAVVVLTATVTPDEKASVGTLFDLVSFCTDTLRVPLPAAGAVPPASPSPPGPAAPAPYSAAALHAVARGTLEGTLLLAAAQLGLWAAHPDAQGGARQAAAVRKEVAELASDLGGVLDRVGGVGGGKADGLGGLAKAKAVRFDAGGTGVSAELVGCLKGFVCRMVE